MAGKSAQDRNEGAEALTHSQQVLGPAREGRSMADQSLEIRRNRAEEVIWCSPGDMSLGVLARAKELNRRRPF